MNLISCKQCGVVLDKDRLIFPDPWDDEEGCYNNELCEYDGYKEEFVPVVACPVCKGDIPEEE